MWLQAGKHLAPDMDDMHKKRPSHRPELTAFPAKKADTFASPAIATPEQQRHHQQHGGGIAANAKRHLADRTPPDRQRQWTITEAERAEAEVDKTQQEK